MSEDGNIKNLIRPSTCCSQKKNIVCLFVDLFVDLFHSVPKSKVDHFEQASSAR